MADHRVSIVQKVEVSGLTDSVLDGIGDALGRFGAESEIGWVRSDYEQVSAFMMSDEPFNDPTGEVYEVIEDACGLAAEHDIEEIEFVK